MYPQGSTAGLQGPNYGYQTDTYFSGLKASNVIEIMEKEASSGAHSTVHIWNQSIAMV